MSLKLTSVINPRLTQSGQHPKTLVAGPKTELFKRFSALTQDPAFSQWLLSKLPPNHSQINIKLTLTRSSITVIVNGKWDMDIDEKTKKAVNDIFEAAKASPTGSRRRRPNLPALDISRSKASRCTPTSPDSSRSSPSTAARVIRNPVRSHSLSSVKPLQQSPLSDLSSKRGFSPPAVTPKPVPQKKKLKKVKVERSDSSLSEKPPKKSLWQTFCSWAVSSKKKQEPAPQQASQVEQLPEIPSSPTSSNQSVQEIGLLPKSPTSPEQVGAFSQPPKISEDYFDNGLNSPVFQLEEIRQS